MKIITLVLLLTPSLLACTAADWTEELGESTQAASNPYDPILYQNCIGYAGPGQLDAGTTSCTMDSQCGGVCPAGKSCGCDKSCNCCYVKDPKLPGPGAEVCRYAWQACPTDGSACPASYELDNQYTWFSNKCDLKTSKDLKDKNCMMHVDPAKPGCVYKATAKGKNCSRPSTGGAGPYECGDKTCDGKESFQCAPGPTGKFTYTLVTDECGES